MSSYGTPVPAQNVTLHFAGGKPTASPDPAPIFKTQNSNPNGNLSVQFVVTAGDSRTYTLTGLNACLNAPSSVDVTSSQSAGPYTVASSVSPPVNGQTFTYHIDAAQSEPGATGGGDGQIQVNP